MPSQTCPGVYREHVYVAPEETFATGVPAFLGYVEGLPRDDGTLNTPRRVPEWSRFEQLFGAPLAAGNLAYAVRGFFENGGRLCYVVRLDSAEAPGQALQRALQSLDSVHAVDLICAPGLVHPPIPEAHQVEPPALEELQAILLKHCEDRGNSGIPDRFAILDCPPEIKPGQALEYCGRVIRQLRNLGGGTGVVNGALYFPWVKVPAFTEAAPGPRGRERLGTRESTVLVPPCGHIAGVYARTDEAAGIQKAPANELIEGVTDLAVQLSDREHGELFGLTSASGDVPAGALNCLRAFPGRGIRVWGARTLSREPAWRYVNVRRLFLSTGRWIERFLSRVAFEPNGPGLWARIERDLRGYLSDLLRRGVLKGRTANEAFYVRCDESINARELRDLGHLVTEVGLAAAEPNEFIIVRFIHRPGAVTLAGPAAPGP
jgi:hypothetical protein